MAGRDDWMAVAEGADPDEIRERILTGYRDGKPFTPYVPTIRLPEPIGSVLDFGCGLGRNFPYLKRIAGAVAGFDLPPMIERCRVEGPAVDLLTSDWADLRTRRFDLVFASLVLQHIEPAPMRGYLADFRSMSPLVYLLTRGRTDFCENLLEIVGSLDEIDVVACVEVDHDPVTHQLRVLGRPSFEAARAAAGEAGDRHYELLLRTAAYSP